MSITEPKSYTLASLRDNGLRLQQKASTEAISPECARDCFGVHLKLSRYFKSRNDARAFIGFTLSEVLITLTIIGVVAAMTIPAINNVVQDVQYKSAYKKAYSTLSQALAMANLNDALNSSTGSYDATILNNFQAIMSYLKTNKTCYVAANLSNCWDSSGEKYNTSYPLSAVDIGAIDASGMSWATYAGGFIFAVFVDTNGFSKPNKFGKDRFMIILTSQDGSWTVGTPAKVVPNMDNDSSACMGTNECATRHNYYATTWLMN